MGFASFTVAGETETIGISGDEGNLLHRRLVDRASELGVPAYQAALKIEKSILDGSPVLLDDDEARAVGAVIEQLRGERRLVERLMRLRDALLRQLGEP